jgi:hypothetical protein
VVFNDHESLLQAWDLLLSLCLSLS